MTEIKPGTYSIDQQYPSDFALHFTHLESGEARITVPELVRAQIAYLKHLKGDRYIPAIEVVLRYLRGVILELEAAWAKEEGIKLLTWHSIEEMPVCQKCGHIDPDSHVKCLSPASPVNSMFSNCLPGCYPVKSADGTFQIHQEGCPNDPEGLSKILHPPVELPGPTGEGNSGHAKRPGKIQTVQEHDPDNTLGAGPKL